MKRSSVIKIGIIAIVVIMILIWGISFLRGENLFREDNEFIAVYEKIDGLSASSPVLMNGYQIGQITEIFFNDDQSGKLTVKMMIGNQYNIPKNSKAEIFSLDLMGSKGVKIIRNDTTDSWHISGDTLIASIEGDLKEQVNMQILPLKHKAEDLIASFDSVLVVIRTIFDESTRRNLAKSFESIRLTIKNLEHTTFTLDTLVTNEKSKLAKIFSNVESITENFKNNNEKLNKVIQNFSDISDSLAAADVAATVKKANKSLAHVEQVVEKINNGQGSLSLLLNNDTLYRNLDNAAYHMNRLLRDINENPKRYVRFSLIDLGRTKYIEAPEDDIRKKDKKSKKDKKKKNNEKSDNN